MEAQTASGQDQRGRPPRRPPPPSTQSSSQSTNDRVTRLKSMYDEGYLYIDQALTLDEQGQMEQAVHLYSKGINCINKGLTIHCDASNCDAQKLNTVRNLREKMMRTKAQVQSRLDILRTDSSVQRALADPPPSYESVSTLNDMDIGDSIMNDASDDFDSTYVANAKELYKIDDGVQIFFITPEGYVSAPSYPSQLRILEFTDQEENGASNDVKPPAFLQVGGWSYPLIPGSSPVLHANYGAYIFPDVMNPEQGLTNPFGVRITGCSVGVMIPDNVSEEQRSKFESLMGSLTAMRTQTPEAEPIGGATAVGRATAARSQTWQPPRAAPRTSETLAKGLVTAAEWVSWGLEKGAEKGGQLLQKGRREIMRNMQPESQPAAIDPKYQKGLEHLRVGTHAVVKVSGFLVDKLGVATMYIGRQVAPHLRKQGEKYLPASFKKDTTDGRSKVDNVMEVAAGGLLGFATVWMSLESAAKALGKGIASETVQVMQYKYGQAAGQLTEHAMYSAGNIAMAAYNVDNLGVKAIAKRAAKDTGKAVIEDYAGKEKKPKPSENGNGSSSHPPSQ